MQNGVTVIYELTVYPGVMEEIHVPLQEQYSGLKWKEGFHAGYSVERISLGDKAHGLTNFIKGVLGDAPEAAAKLSSCTLIVTASVRRASSIRIDEAARVIENALRDLTIALMNKRALNF